MADEIKLDAMTVTPEVLETIAEIATREVEGVAGVDGGIVSLINGKKGVVVCADEGGALVVTPEPWSCRTARAPADGRSPRAARP